MSGDQVRWVDPDGETVIESEIVDDGVVAVRLTGFDGNVFSIIGRVSQALIDRGRPDDAAEFSSRAFDCSSYDEVLLLVFDYVEVL